MFRPVKPDPTGSRGFQQHAVCLASTTAEPAVSQLHASRLSDTAQSTMEPVESAAAAAAGVSDEAAQAAARLSGDAEASHLTLLTERQVLPEVATGRSMDVMNPSAKSSEMPDVSQSSGEVSPVKDEVLQDVATKRKVLANQT